MLTKCPECDLPVSDKAWSCPHCGNPLKEEPKRQRKTSKRMRLPNGFGQITELKGRNLRKPFRAMVSIGKKPNGRPDCKLLKPEAYFETYNQAYAALMEYNKNPYELESTITVKSLYDKWTEEYFKTLKSESSVRTITAAWQYCSSLENMRARDVRARHLKGCIDDGYKIVNDEKIYPTPGVKARMKSLFNLMFDYAVEYEISDKNYARTFDLDSDIVDDAERSRRAHIPFTSAEMKTLWENKDLAWADVILIQCYSGWRPQELCKLEISNVDLVNWTFTGGMKTDAGFNRTVPIHSKIRSMVKTRYDESVAAGSKYLFTCTDSATHKKATALTYDKYKGRFEKVMNALRLNPDHRPHDARVQFVSAAKKYNVDEYAIKYMVGHEISDITESVYTVREPEWLASEIEKIK